ncbi:MAG: permease-like cell division protein FtsX [Thermodesulfovibrionales bacterium]|nr:permease-like cell division protein FtsX [Thermodesulfovibrionales bacterium]
MYVSYSIKTGLKSLIQEKWINLLCILTVAGSLLIIILTGLALYNIENLADKLHERYGMVIFLDEKLSENEIRTILSKIERKEEVLSLKYISKDLAMKELKERLKDMSYIFDGLDVNPLTPAVEITIKKNFINSKNVRELAESLKKINGIEDVYSAEKIAESINYFYMSLTNLSIIILITLIVGVIFVVYSTVKILFYRRKEEIDIIKLIGATKSFIRMPFLVEGGIIGFLGGLLSITSAFVFYFALTYRLGMLFPFIDQILFPTEFIIVFPFIGSFLGIVGAFIAVGRLKF